MLDQNRRLIGRRRELEDLLMSLDEAVAGRGSLHVICGEAGIGKSRLVEELSNAGRERGIDSVWGRCWEAGGAPPFWPWIEILRTAFEAKDEAELGELLGAAAGDIIQLIPELAKRMGAAEVAPLAPVAERFRLFDAVSVTLSRLSSKRPLIVIFEDLHAADAETLLLLTFVAQRSARTRLFFLGTYRDFGVRLRPEIADLLNGLTKLSRPIRLKRLDRDGVAEMLEAVAPLAEASTVDRVYAATEGNPLFINEVLHLVGLDAEIPIPDSIRGAIRQHLLRIDDDARRTLEVAAAVGRTFVLSVVAQVLGPPADSVKQHATEAARVGLVSELGFEKYTFSHGLIREVLHQDMSEARRSELHFSIASVLEQTHAHDPSAPLGEIAHHFAQAGPQHAELALDYLQRAARRSLEAFAYEEAANSLERALELLNVAAPGDAMRRFELNLDLGDARMRAGQGDRGKEACLAAARIARQLKAPELLGRVALTYGSHVFVAIVDRQLVDLLNEALSKLPSEHGTLRARLLARLAAALQPARDPRRPKELAAEALEMTRGSEDRVMRLAVLNSAGSAFAEFPPSEPRVEIDGETVTLALELGEKSIALRGYVRLLWDHIELADLEAAEGCIAAYEALATEFRQPHVEWPAHMFRAMLARLAGRFEEADAEVECARTIARRAEDPRAAMYLATHELAAARIADDRDRIRKGVARMMEQFRGAGVAPFILNAIHAGALARAGDIDQARALYNTLVDDCELVAHHYPPARVGFVEACHALGARDAASRLYPLLAFDAGHLANWGASGTSCEGPLERGLMLLALTLERREEAARHFQSARELTIQIGARPARALIEFEYARSIADADASEARSWAESSAVESRQLGMNDLAERAEQLAGELGGRAAGTLRRKELDELSQRVQSEKMASLGQLVAGVAHEMNTPLGALQANVDVLNRVSRVLTEALQDAELGDALRKNKRVLRALETLERTQGVTPEAMQRIARVVKDLKNFAKLDQAEEEETDLRESLDATLSVLGREIENRIDIVKVYGEIPKIRCRAVQLNQAFFNIATNAVEAIADRGTITVSTALEDDSIVIRIEDTGVGMSPEVLARVFDPGFTTKGVGVGVGLGLSIAYRIIEAHGGTIRVESEVGHGSAFIVELPSAQP